MLLTGTYPRTLDDKNRLTLPKRVRDQLGDVEQVFICPGPDECLWIFDQGALEAMTTRLSQTPATDSEARVFRRLLFAQMESVEIDRSSRVLIPERLRQLAELDHDVVLLGVQDHLELWHAAKWDRYLATHGPRFDAVAEKAFQK